MAARLKNLVIGRNEVISEIYRMLYTPLVNSAPLLLLDGEEGIGKSLILRAVALDARSRGFTVVWGRGVSSEIPQPFHVLQQLLNSLKSERAEEVSPPEAGRPLGVGLMGTFGRDRRSSVPMLLLPIGATMESSEEREARLLATLSGRESDKEEEQMALFDRLADHFEEAALDRKLLIAVDDIHYADRASMEFIDYFARRVKGHSIKLIATLSPEKDLPGSLTTTINSMSREGLAHRITLRRMSEPESYEFVKGLAGSGREIPPEKLKEWYAMSKGNPLMLEQFLRVGTAGTGELEIAGKGGAGFLALGKEARKTLSYAAVMGKHFRFSTLHRALGGNEEKLTETIDGFILRGTLRDKGDESYQFANEELWAEAYNSLTERHRRILHGKAAAALEAEDRDNPMMAFDLANHYHLARDLEKATKYNRAAAEIAKQSKDCETTAHFLEQALQDHRAMKSQDRKEEEGIVVDLAICLDTMGNVERAISLLQEVVVPGMLTLQLARLHTHAGRWMEAEELVMGTLPAVESSGDPALTGMAHRMLGSMATYRGKYEEATKHYANAVMHLQKAGLKAEAASAKLQLAEKKRLTSTVSDAEIKRAYEEVITELRDLDNPTLLTAALMNYGLWYAEKNLMTESVTHLEDALKEANRCHDSRLAGWAMFNLADVLFTMGDVERASHVNQEARTNLERVGDKLGLIQVHLVNGRVLQKKGDLQGAEIEILDAFRLAEEVGFEPDRLEVLFRQGELFLQKGDREGALRRLEELDTSQFSKIRPDLKGEVDRFRATLKP